MRVAPIALVAALVVLSGCAIPFASSGGGTPTAGEQPTPQGTDRQTTGELGDPKQDRIGWEDGYWYNESIDVTTADGLNESEFQAVFARTQARVEYIRGKEFVRDVDVERFDPRHSPDVITPREGESLRTFEDVRMEALFLVGEDRDGRDAYWNAFGNRPAFYDYWNHSAVLLVTDAQNPQVDPETLSHELAHALQDQHYNLSDFVGRPTLDGSYARRAVMEGSAKFVDREYVARCEADWECVEAPDRGSSSTNWPHKGLASLQLTWYEHGMAFLAPRYESAGWEGIDAVWEDPPASMEQIIHPERYGTDPPNQVALNDSHSGDWDRVRPDRGFPYQARPAHARNGQAALVTTFVQTATSQVFQTATYDAYNGSAVVDPMEMAGGSGWGSDPAKPHADYGLNYTDGWEGDRLHVYHRGNETAYVWRLAWENASEAREFQRGYRRVLQHWGGDSVGDHTWVVAEDSPYGDAFYVDRTGDTVTIVNAPAVEDLGSVYAGAAG